MFNNFKLVFDFLIDTFGSIANLMIGTVLVFSLVIWILTWVVKVFKRFIG